MTLGENAIDKESGHGSSTEFAGPGSAGEDVPPPQGYSYTGSRDAEGNATAAGFAGIGASATLVQPPGSTTGDKRFSLSEFIPLAGGGAVDVPKALADAVYAEITGSAWESGTVLTEQYTQNADGSFFWNPVSLDATNADGTVDLAAIDAQVPTTFGPGWDGSNIVYVGNTPAVNADGDPVAVPVYITAPNMAFSSDDGTPISVDNGPWAGTDPTTPSGIVGASAAPIVDLQSLPVDLINAIEGAGFGAFTGPPYPTSVAIEMGYVTSADDNTTLGWHVLGADTADQFAQASQYWDTFTSWSYESLWFASGLVATVEVTNEDESVTTLFVYSTEPSVGVHVDSGGQPTSVTFGFINPGVPLGTGGNADGTDTGNYVALNTDANWTPNNDPPVITRTSTDGTGNTTPQYTDLITYPFNEGDVKIPSGLWHTVNELVASLNGGTPADALYNGVAISFVINDGEDESDVQIVWDNPDLSDAWNTDPAWLLGNGFIFSTNDPTDNDPQVMAVAMGLSDADGWSYLGSVTLDDLDIVFFYTTKPGLFTQADSDGNIVAYGGPTPQGKGTGFWNYTPLTTGTLNGGGEFPTAYTYDPSLTIGDPGSGKFRLSESGDLSMQDSTHIIFSLSATDFNGNDMHAAIIANAPSDATGTDALWTFNQDGDNGQIDGGVNVNGGDTGYLTTDHGTWIEMDCYFSGGDTTIILSQTPGGVSVAAPPGA